MVRAEIECSVYAALPKRPINYLVYKTGAKSLLSNIYTIVPLEYRIILQFHQKTSLSRRSSLRLHIGIMNFVFL